MIGHGRFPFSVGILHHTSKSISHFTFHFPLILFPYQKVSRLYTWFRLVVSHLGRILKIIHPFHENSIQSNSFTHLPKTFPLPAKANPWPAPCCRWPPHCQWPSQVYHKSPWCNRVEKYQMIKRLGSSCLKVCRVSSRGTFHCFTKWSSGQGTKNMSEHDR